MKRNLLLLSFNLTKGFTSLYSTTLPQLRKTTALKFSTSIQHRSDMKRFKVLIANDTIPSIATDILKEECEVIVCKDEENAIKRNIPGVDALFWASYQIVLDEDLLNIAGSQLKAIATMSVGYDNVDVSELKKRNIKFGNTPGIISNAVAEQAVMLALAASRRLNEGRMAILESTWPNENVTQWMLGMEISGSTVGIVGLGSIGQGIVKKLAGFEVGRYLYTGHKEKSEGRALNAEFVSLDELVSNSDYIFSCVPLNNETENLFNYGVFSKMKKNAVFVNVGRGKTVNQPDLVKALKENLIFAAGLDVMTPEPLPPDDELLKMRNCIIAPHLGTATRKTSNKMAELAARNILKALNGEPMLTPVF